MRKYVYGGVVVLLLAIAIAATRVSSLQGSRAPGRERGRVAPEFVGISSWVNSEPLTLRALRGKVVWIDFWTYSCINCVRTFPALRQIYARYHDAGLEIVGVHSPEFSFEKDLQNVRAAIARHQLPYPVALDNQMKTWRAFRNQYWPRVYLIDKGGTIRFDHIGEGGEEELQTQVRALLRETGARLPERIVFDAIGAPTPHITPEIYAGYERGGDPSEFFSLTGAWRTEREFVEAGEDGARIELPFFAREVYFVGSGKGGEVKVLLDGRPVAAPEALRLDREDLFHALSLPTAERHVLSMLVPRGFRLYTFTFG